jgi:hypothetical protein
MKQIITLDMAATAEFNVLERLLEFQEATMRAALPLAPEHEKPAIEARLAEILADKALPLNDGMAHVVVGYLPPAKRAELAHRTAVLFRGRQPDEYPAEAFDAYDDIEREWIRWGVRGHRGMPFPFAQVPVQWRGKTHAVVADEVLDQYQFNDLLHPLKVLVEQYNRMDEEKKTQ